MDDTNKQCGRASRFKLRCFFHLPICWLMGRLDYVRYLFRLTKPASYICTDGDDSSFLKICLPAHCVGPKPASQWAVSLAQAKEEATLSYQLYIPRDFEFVKGGKLPGMAGGFPMGGGARPDGRNGWSARYMFKENGTICSYLYHMDMPDKFGDKFFLRHNDGTMYNLPLCQWITIEQHVKMNNLDDNDGQILTRIDGELLSVVRGLRFRTSETLMVDKIFFSCFYGGGDVSYAPSKDCFLYFKDFKVID